MGKCGQSPKTRRFLVARSRVQLLGTAVMPARLARKGTVPSGYDFDGETRRAFVVSAGGTCQVQHEHCACRPRGTDGIVRSWDVLPCHWRPAAMQQPASQIAERRSWAPLHVTCEDRFYFI